MAKHNDYFETIGRFYINNQIAEFINSEAFLKFSPNEQRSIKLLGANVRQFSNLTKKQIRMFNKIFYNIDSEILTIRENNKNV